MERASFDLMIEHDMPHFINSLVLTDHDVIGSMKEGIRRVLKKQPLH